jgi:Zn-dependent protease
MAWQDRHYYRDRPGAGNPLMWLLTGSVHLFTLFGIRVRAHASLIILIALILLLGWGGGSVATRVQSASILFAVILLHEFGHCFGARMTGGDAEEILMTPLGGIAMTMSRRRPWPTFVTVACGPLVNVLLCLICGVGIWLLERRIFVMPSGFSEHFPRGGWLTLYNYLYWIYGFSLALLIFNMLPVYPLDGGQLVQSLLWKPVGYFKSMMLMLNIGIGGSILMIMVGLATLGAMMGGLLLILIGVSCLLTCIQTRSMMKAEGQWAFQEEESGGFDYSASLFQTEKPKRVGFLAKRAAKRAQRQAAAERDEQGRIDAILEKVSQHGMHSLNWLEKRTLRKATEHQRQRDAQAGRSRRL